MTHKLVGSVIVASLIFGNDAKCMSQEEYFASLSSAASAFMSTLSADCSSAASSTTGSPPACAANTKTCGLLIQVDMKHNCTGSNCSNLPIKPNDEVQSQNFTEQTCTPTVCANDADMAKYLSYWTSSFQEQLQNSICHGNQHLESQAQVSIGTQMAVKRSEMSCDKNTQGEIVIDGQVIPVNTPMPTDNMGGSMTTCGAVKGAYKAAGCCGNPSKTFSMPDGMQRRRLSEEEELLESVKAALQNAQEVGGPSKARSLAEALGAILQKHD